MTSSASNHRSEEETKGCLPLVGDPTFFALAHRAESENGLLWAPPGLTCSGSKFWSLAQCGFYAIILTQISCHWAVICASGWKDILGKIVPLNLMNSGL